MVLRFGFSMEPVTRPGWASPLVLGVHARSFYSALPEQPTKAVLQALRGDASMLRFLERHPLGRLEFSGRMPNRDWLGYYEPESGDLTINAFRGPDTYAQEFDPRQVASVSCAGASLVEAMQRSLYHELGHAILDVAGPDVHHQIRNLVGRGRTMPVSRRARRDAAEYFSETFTAYRFEDALADKDPEGYDMVEAVLRMVHRK